MKTTECLKTSRTDCFRPCCSPAGSFWVTVPVRETTAEEADAIRELVALEEALEEEESQALRDWLAV